MNYITTPILMMELKRRLQSNEQDRVFDRLDAETVNRLQTALIHSVEKMKQAMENEDGLC